MNNKRLGIIMVAILLSIAVSGCVEKDISKHWMVHFAC